MNKFFPILVGMLIGGSLLAQAENAVTYKTSTSAVFTQVQGPGTFGKAWQDPSGAIWSSYQGEYTNDAIQPDQNSVVVDSPATEACAKIGGALPTAQQYSQLASYFEMDQGYLTIQGRKDIFAIFPDMADSQGKIRGFWTSTVSPSDAGVAYVFSGYSGVSSPIQGYRINYEIGVRCIAH